MGRANRSGEHPLTGDAELEGVSGRHWHMLDDGGVQCDVCPRFCKLREGQRGLCFVRGRRDARIVLTTWGRSSGFCIDPIGKSLNRFLPGTPVLSFGTAGCNPTCKICQNRDISKARVHGRDWYRITRWRPDPDGRCAGCGTKIAGVFEPRPGTWGPRRAPVRIAEPLAAARK